MTQLSNAYGKAVEAIRTVPDEALNWQISKLEIVQSLSDDELERNFACDVGRFDQPSDETTLRKRVIDTCADHLLEHRDQLMTTLARWRAAQEEA